MLEMYRKNEVISWGNSTNPGGDDDHFGVVTYGADPSNLSRTARGDNRLNRGQRYTVFRVRPQDVIT